MKFVLLYVLLLSLVGCSSEQEKINKITKSTVMITNLAENSGGSGTILSSSPTLSVVLTNSHVCEVVRKGGYVHSHVGKSFVYSFIQSESHDLCILSVRQDLRASTSVAPTAPRLDTPVMVSGHPHLLPVTLTTGHMTRKIVIKILTGIKPCTAQEALDSNTGLFCMFLGGIPILKSYEATPVSALIQPGSSGSAVYDSDGNIIAVIFAGSGDLGYGLAVPYESIVSFLRGEHRDDKVQSPTTEAPLISLPPTPQKFNELLKEACNNATTEKQKELCDKFFDASKYILLNN